MPTDLPGSTALPDTATLDTAEIARFAALAARWWDPAGPMAPLHAMNPARIGWIAAAIAARFPGQHPEILDLGCGGGIAAEALARRGFAVLGLDAAPEAISVARAHAAGAGLALTYRAGRAEELQAEGRRFAVITALEVIEHVPDPQALLRLLAGLLTPGGVLFVSTLNRTRRSWLFAKLGAEYLLHMVPRGTHDWRRFLTPGELAAHASAAGLRLGDVTGLLPGLGGWHTGRDLAVNYLALLEG